MQRVNDFVVVDHGHQRSVGTSHISMKFSLPCSLTSPITTAPQAVVNDQLSSTPSAPMANSPDSPTPITSSATMLGNTPDSRCLQDQVLPQNKVDSQSLQDQVLPQNMVDSQRPKVEDRTLITSSSSFPTTSSISSSKVMVHQSSTSTSSCSAASSSSTSEALLDVRPGIVSQLPRHAGALCLGVPLADAPLVDASMSEPVLQSSELCESSAVSSSSLPSASTENSTLRKVGASSDSEPKKKKGRKVKFAPLDMSPKMPIVACSWCPVQGTGRKVLPGGRRYADEPVLYQCIDCDPYRPDRHVCADCWSPHSCRCPDHISKAY